MKTNLPDDIARLTSDASFEFAAYRSFEKAPRPRLAAAGASALTMPVLAMTTTRPATGSPALRALRTLHQPGRTLPRVARKATLALFASAGGCGVTTIAATLARLLNSREEAVVLVDGVPQSLLGAYFGAGHFHAGVHSIVRPAGEPGAHVHVVNQPPSSNSDWIGSLHKQLNGEYDRMILDMCPQFSAGNLGQVLDGAVGLIPLLPDLRTACNIEPLLERLNTLRSECRAELPLYFVLSQFDPNIRMHCEIRDWLRQSYSSMLLPFALRRSEEVSEALADGSTVIDYAPNSGIAQDFRILAAWVQQLPRFAAGS